MPNIIRDIYLHAVIAVWLSPALFAHLDDIWALLCDVLILDIYIYMTYCLHVTLLGTVKQVILSYADYADGLVDG